MPSSRVFDSVRVEAANHQVGWRRRRRGAGDARHVRQRIGEVCTTAAQNLVAIHLLDERGEVVRILRKRRGGDDHRLLWVCFEHLR